MNTTNHCRHLENRRLLTLAVVLSFAICTGCLVPNKPYHGSDSIYTVPRLDREHPAFADSKCNPMASPCLAFLEFDEMGEMWDPLQLENALSLIKRAKGREGETPTPIIVTFVHGWKNNAQQRKDNAGNVVAFEAVLSYLKSKSKYKNRPLVGVYVSWRGDLVSKYWPVRRQLSFFNRETTATRIPGASMTRALTRIMTTSHDERRDAQVIMIGHSFGGLILERALTQAMTDYLLRFLFPGTATSDGDGTRSFANLVVFLNSAASASEAKQMIDLLMAKGRPFQLQMRTPDNNTSAQNDNRSQRPVFVSLSSLGDAATRFAFPLGHGPGYLRMAANGSWRKYTNPEPTSVASQSSYYLSTTAHMPALQSHVIVDVTKGLGGKPCVPETPISSLVLHKILGTDPAELKPYGHLFPVTGHCYQIFEKPGRWNSSAYWAMEMPATIVPDHSSIFNLNLLALLDQFFLSGDEMNDPNIQPKPSVVFKPSAATETGSDGRLGSIQADR